MPVDIDGEMMSTMMMKMKYDNDTDNAGNEMSEYLKAFGVVCGRSSKYDVEQL